MSRKPLFWLDKVIKKNGDVTTLGKIISDVAENSEGLSWKLLGNVEVEHRISLPEKYNELYIFQRNSGISLSIPAVALIDTEQTYQSCFYASTSDYANVLIRADKSQVYFYSYMYNGSPVANRTVEVYYR